MSYFGAPALQLLLLRLLRLLLQSPIATASRQQFLAVAVAYKRPISSGNAQHCQVLLGAVVGSSNGSTSRELSTDADRQKNRQGGRKEGREEERGGFADQNGAT
jgi:hypothetical protein